MVYDLEELPRDVAVCVDANILTYHFVEQGHLTDICQALFLRSARKEIRAYTTAIATSEATHRVMVAEAGRLLGLSSSSEIVGYLKKHPEFVRRLRENLAVIGDVHNKMGVEVLPVSHRDLHNSKRIRRSFGLLTNDSILLAVMQSQRIVHLATHDRDFRRVGGVKVWMPSAT